MASGALEPRGASARAAALGRAAGSSDNSFCGAGQGQGGRRWVVSTRGVLQEALRLPWDRGFGDRGGEGREGRGATGAPHMSEWGEALCTRGQEGTGEGQRCTDCMTGGVQQPGGHNPQTRLDEGIPLLTPSTGGAHGGRCAGPWDASKTLFMSLNHRPHMHMSPLAAAPHSP
jgi:hypothetical protein